MSLLKYAPAVFAVAREYQIAVRVTEPCVMWVEIGEKCYYDDSNGILRSMTDLHKISVPQSVLDPACEYTVCYRRIIERKPYFSELEGVTRETFAFKPVTSPSPRAYHIADSHGVVESTVLAARKYIELRGELDFLILNGDVIDHSGALANFDAIYDICSQLTGGKLPIVFSRGNHDTRGIYAEKIADYTPTRDGFSYFTFRLGGIWGIVLDCAEDKPDTNPEYGHTICCHAFRIRETEYLKQVISRAEEEYLAEGVTHRIVIAHSPFTKQFEPPFNIEEDIYRTWTELLNEYIKPHVMICGHLHKLEIYAPGCDCDYYGQTFPVAVGSLVDHKKRLHTGSAFVFADGYTDVAFVNEKEIIEEHKI